MTWSSQFFYTLCAAETVMKTITEELAMGSDTQHEDNKELKYIAGQV